MKVVSMRTNARGRFSQKNLLDQVGVKMSMLLKWWW